MVENEPRAGSGIHAETAPAIRPSADAELPAFQLRPAFAPAPRLDFSAPPLEVSPGPPPSGKLSRRLDAHGEFPADSLPPVDRSLAGLANLRPLGQIHESFIVAAGCDGLWIIDQHVAHERILFEQVLKQRAAGRVEIQHLLMPLILQLTPEQQIEYARIEPELLASGFETEVFGNRTIAVKAAPAAVGPADLEKILYEISRSPRKDRAALALLTTCAGTSAPRSPAALPSRSTPVSMPGGM